MRHRAIIHHILHGVCNTIIIDWAQAWTPLLLDIELVGNFWKSQTNSDIKKFMKYHQNIFKSYNEFETLKVIAQKLSPSCPLEF